jgi:YqaJ-like viral recombinase domain
MDNYQNWQNTRLGKFTASEISKLLVSGKSKTEYFGKSALSYIDGKLAEILTQQSLTDLTGIPAIEHGNSLEHLAMMEFEKRSGMKVEYYGGANPMFFELAQFADFAGGSPDGIANDKHVLEVKCPYNPLHHLQNLKISSQQDLAKERPEYYAQLQFNMLCCEKLSGYFISYDDRFLDDNQKLKVVRIEQDTEFQQTILERLGEAIKLLKVTFSLLDTNIVTATYDSNLQTTLIN